MTWILRKLRGLSRCKSAFDVPNFQAGTKFSFRYRVRRFLSPYCKSACYIRSKNHASLYVSSDPIDEIVAEELLGNLGDIYFPQVLDSIVTSSGGWLLDVGAFNGYWAAEMLVRYPGYHAVLVEPNPDKIDCIERTLLSTKVRLRARIVHGALAATDGTGGMHLSQDGSWGNWVACERDLRADGNKKISTLSLKSILAGVSPIVIKCNSEGGEYELIKQLITDGLRPKLIILMVHPERGNPYELRDLLCDMGYEIKIARDGLSRPCWHAIKGSGIV